ncbi:MAG: translocation/assembly module TamB domain-containing protein [Crocinitomicaceae bacterium]|nr:translocation/assembly module TamB domain-containing protein [Flavobacteriales bacterium]NQZ35031.1 translocation/assembly module TamB domain-containing protein [Crocinitomicaceae bacterium]
MAKLLKILGRTLGIIFEWLLVFLIALAFFIRTSPVQTYLAQQATSYLSEELNTAVNIDKVDIVFFDKVALNGFLILDQQKDTLLAAKTVFATLDDYILSDLKFKVGKVRLDEAYGHLKKDKNGTSNLKFIVDYFKSDKPPSGKKLQLAIHTVELTNSRFKYDDDRKDIKDFGVDFAHLDLSNVNGNFEDVSIVGSDVKATITNLSAYEKSGLNLKNISSIASVGKNGIYLSDLNIDLNDSKLNAPKFNLIYSGFDDFSHFVDSVKFDGQLAESTVSLKDVSFFASALEGMDEIVQIKGDVSDVVNKLKIRNLDLRVKDKTRLMGSINLPNFKKMDQAFFHEKLDYAYVDLNEIQQIRLPNSSSTPYLKLDKYTKRLGYFEAKDVRFDMAGTEFVVASDIVRTRLGSARLDNGIKFEKKDHSLAFTHSENSTYDFKVEEFDLGAFLQNKDLGIVDGIFFVQGEAFSTSNIDFTKIEGKVNRFDFMQYSYTGIDITKGEFKDNRFAGIIDVIDDNLNLNYDGYIDFNGPQKFNFTANIGRAFLDRLNLTSEKAELLSTFHVDLIGSTPENLTGRITAEAFHYCEGGRDLHVPELTIDIHRGNYELGELDKFTLTSNVANASIEGKVNFDHLIGNLDYQLSRILPALFKRDVLTDRTHTEDHFEFNIEAQNPDDFLAIFLPELKISKNTNMSGHYYGESSNFVMKLNSDSMSYDNFQFNNIVVDQMLDSNSVVTTFDVKEVIYRDTISFHDLYFKTSGGNDQLVSDLTWDEGTPYASHIRWETAVRDKDHFNFVLDPSYFSLKDNRWEIANASTIQVNKDTISVTQLKIEQGKQFISFDGKISSQDQHRLKYSVNNVDLSQLDAFIDGDVRMKGLLNSWGYISNPFKNLDFVGDAHIMQFEINETEIGDIFAHSEWDKPTKSIQLDGDLMYKAYRTFDFQGSYFTEGKRNAKGQLNFLAFDLVFNNTDISFTNSFMDPDVVNDIKGLLNGKLSINGTLEKPELNGTVRLDEATANVKLLGARFGVEGPIRADKDGFYIDGIPIFDEEGNSGLLIGTVNHNSFEKFNFDLLVDMEIEGVPRDPKRPWIRKPLERFLVMNSQYSPESLYYGKAYATGLANISGYSDNLEITVNLKTEKGTDIKFPMYGAGEIDEEFDFITFTQDSSSMNGKRERKIDFTGVNLDLHFDITDDADLQIIFNEELGDIISAKGKGNIAIKLDNLGDIRMDGTYTITEGVYDFTMGVIKQPFIIEKGGNIAWTGNPYNAQLNLRTYKKVTANLAALSADQFSGGTNAHEDIRCYLILTETLLKPAISFDIEAPNTNSAGKSLIERVRKDKDELNRQFFSLMLANTFQPLGENGGAGQGGAAVDLLENQINGLLAKVSSDYKLNLNLDKDGLTGDNTYEFGLKKGFLDDRLIFSGSFGVESEADNHNSFIGDVNLEYRLNESGTFRVNIFNESNDKTIIQNQQKGHFTQGAGLHYQEDFNGADDFKAFQSFLDIFRKKENKRNKNKRKKRQVPVPPKQGEIVPTDDN